MKQVTGRIVYVAPMMPEGRFWLSEILVLANIDKDLRLVVNIDQETRAVSYTHLTLPTNREV